MVGAQADTRSGMTLSLICNPLLINTIILTVPWAEQKNPFRSAGLDAIRKPYPQSYSQILWVVVFCQTAAMA
jgi:hypothetical protein